MTNPKLHFVFVIFMGFLGRVQSSRVKGPTRIVQKTLQKILVFTVYTVYTKKHENKEVSAMAVKALNFKMDEADILDMKQVAGVYSMTVTDLIKNAVKEYLQELKGDPFYRLTANVQDASREETEEILAEIDGLSEDDLTIASTKQFTV